MNGKESNFRDEEGMIDTGLDCSTVAMTHIDHSVSFDETSQTSLIEKPCLLLSDGEVNNLSMISLDMDDTEASCSPLESSNLLPPQFYLPIKNIDIENQEQGTIAIDDGMLHFMEKQQKNPSKGLLFEDRQDRSEQFSFVYLSAVIRKFLQWCFFVAIALFIALFVFVWPRNFSTESNTANLSNLHHRGMYEGKPAYEVLLTGDSLNLRPWQFHNLGGRIQDHLPTIALFFHQGSLASYTMAKINKAIGQQIQYKPDFAFVCEDTDISSSGLAEWKMTPDQVTHARNNYKGNLTAVIEQLKQNVTYFAFAGPNLLGEHKVEPGFYSVSAESIFAHKRQQLNAYVQMNEEVCAAHGVKYINLHSIFSNQIPPQWPFAAWYVTVDGEHPNRYGTELMAREYALAIKEWLNLSDSDWKH